MHAVDAQLAALADPTRRSILERLASRPMSVAELASGFAVSRPAVSQHLRVLKEARLVKAAAQGTRNFYSVDSHGLAALHRYFDALWDRALGDFKAAAEASYQRKRRS